MATPLKSQSNPGSGDTLILTRSVRRQNVIVDDVLQPNTFWNNTNTPITHEALEDCSYSEVCEMSERRNTFDLAKRKNKADLIEVLKKHPGRYSQRKLAELRRDARIKKKAEQNKNASESDAKKIDDDANNRMELKAPNLIDVETKKVKPNSKTTPKNKCIQMDSEFNFFSFSNDHVGIEMEISQQSEHAENVMIKTRSLKIKQEIIPKLKSLSRKAMRKKNLTVLQDSTNASRIKDLTITKPIEKKPDEYVKESAVQNENDSKDKTTKIELESSENHNEENASNDYDVTKKLLNDTSDLNDTIEDSKSDDLDATKILFTNSDLNDSSDSLESDESNNNDLDDTKVISTDSNLSKMFKDLGDENESKIIREDLDATKIMITESDIAHIDLKSEDSESKTEIKNEDLNETKILFPKSENSMEDSIDENESKITPKKNEDLDATKILFPETDQSTEDSIDETELKMEPKKNEDLDATKILFPNLDDPVSMDFEDDNSSKIEKSNLEERENLLKEELDVTELLFSGDMNSSTDSDRIITKNSGIPEYGAKNSNLDLTRKLSTKLGERNVSINFGEIVASEERKLMELAFQNGFEFKLKKEASSKLDEKRI